MSAIWHLLVFPIKSYKPVIFQFQWSSSLLLLSVNSSVCGQYQKPLGCLVGSVLQGLSCMSSPPSVSTELFHCTHLHRGHGCPMVKGITFWVFPLGFLCNHQIDTPALARCGADWAGGDELGWDAAFYRGLWTVVVLQESLSLFCSRHAFG